jgi:hypothetical protein
VLYYTVSVRFGEERERACVHMCSCDCLFVCLQQLCYLILICSLVCFILGSSCNISRLFYVFFWYHGYAELCSLYQICPLIHNSIWGGGGMFFVCWFSTLMQVCRIFFLSVFRVMILKQHLMKFWFCEFCQKEFLRMIKSTYICCWHVIYEDALSCSLLLLGHEVVTSPLGE